MMKYIHDFTVTDNIRQNHEFVVLTLKCDSTIPEIVPGQFAEVRVDNASNTFLRRPLSIHDVNYNNNSLKLLIQEVGEGTKKLSNLNKGDSINMVYPLGKGFTKPLNDQKSLLVGGGCGVAPLLFLGRYLVKNNITPRFLIGAKSSKDLIRLDEYRDLGEVMITTEDGSEGVKGFIIHHPVLKTEKPDFNIIYTCGPDGMMRVLSKYAAKHNIDCQVSLENNMACGFGACLCCVTPTQQGHKCTCIDGPVFDSKYLKW
ncbi:dihydroorotate dehydrogenase electron transfer subunit [Marinilabiliaceae bacterium ANBcel2]|nr:dihydroorotate dehydrogenase electron transfer subunit [Marinilabiliaceae bacterium ANBcel2]